MSNHRVAKRFLVGSDRTPRKSMRQRKVVRTTAGELITAVTEAVAPIIHSPSRLYTVVSWIHDDLSVRNQIRVHKASRRKLPIYFAEDFARTNLRKL
jgi:hypothetical protein